MLVPRFDPRADALAKFGQGLGSGVGDILSRFMEAKQFQSQMQGITPETPVNELVSKLSNVSPQLRETYLSPVIQNRLAQQRAQKVFQDLASKSPEQLSQIPYPQLIAQLGAAFANVPEGYRAAEPFIKALTTYHQAQRPIPGSGIPGIQASGSGSSLTGAPTTQTVPVGQRGNVRDTAEQYVPQPSGAQVVRRAGSSPRGGYAQPIGEVPAIGEVTFKPDQSNVYGVMQDYMNKTPNASYKDALDYAQNIFNLEESQLNRLYTAQQTAETQRQQQVGEQERVRGAAVRLLSKDYGVDQSGRINLPPEYQNMLTDIMIQDTKGTDEQRYTKSKKVIEDIVDRVRNLSSGETRPFVAGLRPGQREKFIENKKGAAQAILSDKRIDDVYRPFIREQMRTALTNWRRPLPGLTGRLAEQTVDYLSPESRGGDQLSPFEVEEIVNPPSKAIRAALHMVGSPKKNAEENRIALENFWAQIAKDSLGSPLYAAQELVDKGYSEDQIKAAFDAAKAAGVDFSEYQMNQRNEFLTKRLVPNLSTIFGNDRALKSLSQMFLEGMR